MSAKASGSDANGDAKHRSHHDGSSGRAYTVEQKAAVLRIRKCQPTAFYDILGLEQVKTTCSDGEIKKAYRKLSLLTHPDKNGYDGADEAFKMIARAFQVLSDADKKAQFDRSGHDPDSRFQQQTSSPFGRASAQGRPPGFGGPFGQQGSFFDDEISPEDLFRQFFGGGGMGGFGFDTGPGFVFNLGGGPGMRVHQMGGGRPRRRPDGSTEPAPPQTLGSMIQSLLPLLVLFIFPLLSSIFGGSSANTPSISLNQRPPYTTVHKSSRLGINYFVNPAEVQGFKRSSDWRQLDRTAENHYMHSINEACELETRQQQNLFYEAQGWFSNDEAKLERARNMEKKSCIELEMLRRKW